MEIWKDVPNYEENYQASTMGRIKSKDRYIYNKYNKSNTFYPGKILKLNQKRHGYLSVDLAKNGKTKTMQVHRIIANTFIPNPENKPQINHINAIKTDNRVQNLEWVTAEENREHAKENNLYVGPNRKKVRCRQLNIIFESSYEAGEYINKNKFQYSKQTKNIATKIRACANGYQKTAYGYTWEQI